MIANLWDFCFQIFKKHMKIQFLKGLSSSVIKPLQGCRGMEVVSPFSGLSGTFEVKPVANDEGWHFCSDGATFKGDATKWVGVGISSLGRALHRAVFSFPEAATSPGYRTDPCLHAHGGHWPPARTRAGALLCQGSVNKSLHPLDLVAHLQKRDDDYLLCKVLWDLLEISAFKRGVFPFLSKARSGGNPTVPAFALQRCCLRGEAGNDGDIAVGNIIESHNYYFFFLFHSINLHGCSVFS